MLISDYKDKKIKKLEKQINKANELLRRVYDIIEISHLTDAKAFPFYLNSFKFKRGLGENIFDYLQSKDEIFKNIVIKRQKRYRRNQKYKALKNK